MKYEDLPKEIPVFPLSNFIILKLPTLNFLSLDILT